MILKELGLTPALFNLVERIKKESGIHGEFGCANMEKRLDQNLETAIYRIVQEALNNTVKYSKAEEFSVELINDDKKIHLIISDDGKGFDKEAVMLGKHGMGITNMRERTEAFNGIFRLNSSSEEGTFIIAEFPLEGKNNV
jgi:signal transduction histidine kinase